VLAREKILLRSSHRFSYSFSSTRHASEHARRGRFGVALRDTLEQHRVANGPRFLDLPRAALGHGPVVCCGEEIACVVLETDFYVGLRLQAVALNGDLGDLFTRLLVVLINALIRERVVAVVVEILVGRPQPGLV